MDLVKEIDHLTFEIESMSPTDKTSQQNAKKPTQIQAESMFGVRQETHVVQISPTHKDETKPQENIQDEFVQELYSNIESPQNSEPRPNNQTLPSEHSPRNNTQSPQTDAPNREHSPNIPRQVVESYNWVYRLVSLYIALTVLCGSVAMMPLFGNVSDGIFIIIMIYFAFLLLLDLFRGMPILNFCDAFCGVLYVWILYFKKLRIIPICSFACAPFMLEVLAMLVYPKIMKFTYLKLLLRCYYAAQSLLVALKMDNKIEWDWLIVLASIVCVGVYSSYTLVEIVLIPFKLRNSNSQVYSLPRRTIIIGALWYLGYFISSLLSLFGLISVVTSLEPSGDNSLLTSAAYTGLGVCPLFVAWILIIKEHLLRFTRAFKLNEEEAEELSIEETINLEDGLKIVEFRVEKKESYFVKLSPTYFQSADQNIASPDEERIKKLKQAFYNVKQNRSPKKISCQELASKSVSEQNQLEQEKFTHFQPKTNLAYSANDIDETRRIYIYINFSPYVIFMPTPIWRLGRIHV